MKRCALVLALAMWFGVGVAGGQREPHYSIVDLGVLPGGGFSEALNLNDRGDIVGWGSTSTGEMHAILWQSGQPIDLGTLGGAMSRAWGINDRGQVVGESETATGDFHAFLWEDGTMIDLADAGPFNRAFSVNLKTEVVGHFQGEALLWRRGSLIDLGIRSALAINDRGVIAGATDRGGEFHAVLVHRGTVLDLGTLPGDNSSTGRSVNNHQQVVGESRGATTLRAFLWEDGHMTELAGLLPGGAALARDINNRGWAVGESLSDPNVLLGAVRGVLWIDAAAPIKLGALAGAAVSSAAAINDHGLIVGFSGDGGYDARAVAWVRQR
jgi:probable HAF family extracellular repeat protein